LNDDIHWGDHQRDHIEAIGISKDEWKEAYERRAPQDDMRRPDERLQAESETNRGRELIVVWEIKDGKVYPITAHDKTCLPHYADLREQERERRRRRRGRKNPMEHDLTKEERAHYKRVAEKIDRELVSPAGREQVSELGRRRLRRLGPVTFDVVVEKRSGRHFLAYVAGLFVYGSGASREEALSDLGEELKQLAKEDPHEILGMIKAKHHSNESITVHLGDEPRQAKKHANK